VISAPITKPATTALTPGIQQLATHLSSPQHIDLFSFSYTKQRMAEKMGFTLPLI
jgi:hypothetical protein